MKNAKKSIKFALLAGVLLSNAPSILAADKIVIAHRGASGYLPEHTLEAYAVAHAMGAHYIEPDVVLTKDGIFICLHDIHLQSTTNVEEVFPDKKRQDGKWYAADLTIDEIHKLEVNERLEERFPKGKSSFQVPTLAEMIELIQGLNATRGRNVGIYPELKQPSWHEKQGLPMEKAVLDLVAGYGYTEKTSKIYVQCFEAQSLKRMRDEMGSTLPQIQLVPGGGAGKLFTTDKGLDNIAKYADGIGPDKRLLDDSPDLVERCHKRNLMVHPYTVRADSVGSGCKNVEEELQKLYFTQDVDGLFTDHSDVAAKVLLDGK